MKEFIPFFLYTICICSTSINYAFGQTASIHEEERVLKTYPYSDPNPIPALTGNPKIYPYFGFDGYAHKGIERKWKVVVLENDFIQVFVLPEIGGKIWGAIEKSTGHEFIYRNEVIKFRNIGLRGPWTSGGIEFNFGIMGHTPSTATPVNYLMRKNEDGSATCVVGNMDIPSRTFWRVLINLPSDKAYFETKVVWYNPTNTDRPYYNWMTAAAAVREDMEFFMPGNQYLDHPGKSMPWPYDNGRKLSVYKQNDYGPDKPYHIVGEYSDFFGGYYHHQEFGLGHWAPYDEMPGQKLWLWSLSRSGGIWENLLTDADGQYVEFQAGRQFNQYIPNGDINPITRVSFAPYLTELWSEIWFPLKGIGGMTEVSPSGILNLDIKNDQVVIGINALEPTNAILKVQQDNESLLEEPFSLRPMGVLKKTIPVKPNGLLQVDIDKMDLHYSSKPENKLIARSFTPEDDGDSDRVGSIYHGAMELMEGRYFEKARRQLDKAIAKDPFHRPTLLALAELDYRSGLYDNALAYTTSVLKQDTYHPKANYLAGIIYRALYDDLNAMESMGWAARSIEFRSVGYTQMAGIYLKNGQFEKAERYAAKALDFNRFNVNALKIIAITGRRSKQNELAEEALRQLSDLDPINNFVRFERYLADRNVNTKADFTHNIRNELPFQDYLELAIYYVNLAMNDEAISLLEMAPSSPLAYIWLANLSQADPERSERYLKKAVQSSPDFVFPFRRETLPVLQWAVGRNNSWKLKYYLALNYWAKDRLQEAQKLMEECGEDPDYFVFYLSRAKLNSKLSRGNVEKDILKALQLQPSEWRVYDRLIAYYHENNDHKEALLTSSSAYNKFPSNNSIALKHVRELLYNNRSAQAIDILGKLEVLPSEGDLEVRQLYETAYLMEAASYMSRKRFNKAITLLIKAKDWPERLGVGKPYDPDERAINYLLGICYQRKGETSEANKYFEAVLAHKGQIVGHASFLIQLKAADQLKKQAMLNDLLDMAKTSSDDLTTWAVAIFNDEQVNGIDVSDDLLVRVIGQVME